MELLLTLVRAGPLPENATPSPASVLINDEAGLQLPIILNGVLSQQSRPRPSGHSVLVDASRSPPRSPIGS